MGEELARLEAVDSKSGELLVVVDTPRGSAVKFKHDEELRVFTIARFLPSGLVFPFDFGFVPGTRAEDGDALDVVILMEGSSFPGLVSHLFRARGARTLGSRLESLHLNGALRAGTAAMARILRMPCVVGKSILVSREALNAIGGIEALRDHLAEDYLLGRMIAGAGYRVVLSGDETETAEVSRSLSARYVPRAHVPSRRA